MDKGSDWISHLGLNESKKEEPKRLKTLDEHNAQILAARAKIRRHNGIECPQCGAELLDTRPWVTLMSSPPKKNIHCETDGCGYTGYRLA